MNDNGWTTYSSLQRIEDVPVRPHLHIVPQDDHDNDDLPISWAEAQRLGNHRLWQPILDLDASGDDFWPPANDPQADKFSGA